MVFIYCLLSFLKKHWHIHVFDRVVKKGLAALGVLLTQQILLFEHYIENNFITCGLKKQWHFHVFDQVIKKGLAALGVLLTQQILLFEHCI